MSPRIPLEIKVLSTLLKETLSQADRHFAYILNAGDPGFVETLRQLNANTASTLPNEGRKTIASHANHVLYGIELANRALNGEEGVYENADWDVAWQLQVISDEQWKGLVERLDQQTQLLFEQVDRPREWTEMMLTGTFAIAAHAAYHLGAIRQILLAVVTS